MGIPGLEGELWRIPGCVINVSIAELLEKYGKNVIVVDGFNFYGVYLYPKFDWVCGAIRDLVEEIRRFVEAFEHIGVKLVFFFVDGDLDEGSDRCGSESWIIRHSEFIEYTNILFSRPSQWKFTLDRIKKDRAYYHTPLNALPVVLFALRHIFKCEVHLVSSGDRNDAIAYYSKNNDCLAVLAQDNYYIFYRQVPRYLSIRNLQLMKMTTVQYCPEVLALHKHLEGHLYPFFFKFKSLPSVIKKLLFDVEAELDECESIEVARNTIEGWKKNKCEGLIQPGALKIWERKLPSIFGHEEPHRSKVILELHMSQNGCLSEPINVIPNHVNPVLHPGLLLLWNVSNQTFNIGDQKWQLFASCISDNLQWQLLCSLPPTLVVPTVVLYYLFQVVPPMFKSRSWKFLRSWEVEVFIAQAIMLSKISANSLSKIKIEIINPRVVKLVAYFVHGCHQVRLLIEACGYPISEHDLCLFHFFDGKLFHSFYDRAEWRQSARNLCDEESSILFENMKQIIIPDRAGNYSRGRSVLW